MVSGKFDSFSLICLSFLLWVNKVCDWAYWYLNAFSWRIFLLISSSLLTKAWLYSKNDYWLVYFFKFIFCSVLIDFWDYVRLLKGFIVSEYSLSIGILNSWFFNRLFCFIILFLFLSSFEKQGVYVDIVFLIFVALILLFPIFSFTFFSDSFDL